MENDTIATIEKVQKTALRTIFFGHGSSSVAGMHRLSQLPPMRDRNKDLHARFMHKLHNGTDKSIPAIKLWWNLWSGPHNDIQARARKNPWWQDVTKRTHFDASVLTRGPNLDIANYGLKAERRTQLYRASLISMCRKDDNIAGSISLNNTDGPRQILSLQLPRYIRATVIRRMIGNVAYHQPTHYRGDGACQHELSRQHALECSGAEGYLQECLPELQEHASHNILDHLLNEYKNTKYSELPPNFYEKIYNAVCMILSQCLHYSIMPSGWWKRGIG